MRTLLFALGFALAAYVTSYAQQIDIVSTDASIRVGADIAINTNGASSAIRNNSVKNRLAIPVVIPSVKYYTIAEGEDEDFPPGLYATFLPTSPDTVEVFDEGSASYTSHQVDAGKEMIHGDSASVYAEVENRKGVYAGTTPLAGKARSYVSRSGYIPIETLGPDKHKFAVKPSHFRIAPGAMISATVHLDGDEDLSSVLCMVSSIDYEHNTFTIETSRKVPIGETINWIIVNFPE